ncbi:hypothetical protein [Micromonospora sp. CPCC 205714]|uniref:hypothetical protein n=1 Tax=Micromonospora sp. CPCC 205714 TaxID=3122402 RepID=UPI003FA5298F
MLVCGGIGWEFAKNYRREVMLARALANRGFAVARFHYRGLGDSGGSFDRLTVTSMAADARRVADLLRARSGIDEIAAVGVRLGALVAAGLHPGADGPLVLWEPVLSGEDYLRSLERIQRVWQVSRPTAAAPPSPGPGRPLTVLGFRLGTELVAQLRAARLAELLTPGRREVRSLHVGTLPRGVAELRDLLAATPHGSRLQPSVVPGAIDWWLKRRRFEPEERCDVTRQLVATTVAWLTSGPAPDQLRATPTTLAVGAGTLVGVARRRPVGVPVGGDRLAGILVEPAGHRAELGAVLLNCGSYHPACGPVGLWSEVADRLAALGVTSLRVAYRGVADSTGEVHDFDLTRPRTTDLAAARSALASMGLSAQVLVGGCLGARTACAAELKGLLGLGLVSLPWHRESLATGRDSRTRRPADAGRSIPAHPGWINEGLVRDIGGCLTAGIPIRVVYSRDEPYHRDFRLASADLAGRVLDRHEGRFEVTLVDGVDSMFETGSVAAALCDFVAALLPATHP